MHKCHRCKLLKELSAFHPDLHDKIWCKACIDRERGKRAGTQRREAVKKEREQISILEVVKQFQMNREDLVYLLTAGNRYKIGHTNNLEQRVRTFNTASPSPHKIIAVAPGGKQLEGNLHENLNRFRIFGEWFQKRKEVFEAFQTLQGVMIFLPGYVTENAPAPLSVDEQHQSVQSISVPPQPRLKRRVISSAQAVVHSE